jgi:DNA-binding MarR family transcriptional regulator
METEATDDQPGGARQPEPPESAEDADLGGQLRSAVGRLYRRFRSERSEGSLGDAALAVLTHLHKYGPHTLTELSEHDRVSPASMSQTVNRLTSAGYAVRTQDPGDRRKVLFSATAEGDEVARATRAQRNAWLDAQLRGLSAADRAVIARATALLGSIADS